MSVSSCEFYLDSNIKVVDDKSLAFYKCQFKIQDERGNGSAICSGLTANGGLYRFNDSWQIEGIYINYGWFYTQIRVIIHNISDYEVMVSNYFKYGTSSKTVNDLIKNALVSSIPQSIKLMNTTKTIKEFYQMQIDSIV